MRLSWINIHEDFWTVINYDTCKSVTVKVKRQTWDEPDLFWNFLIPMLK